MCEKCCVWFCSVTYVTRHVVCLVSLMTLCLTPRRTAVWVVGRAASGRTRVLSRYVKSKLSITILVSVVMATDRRV